jgi:hypothetical protein
MNEHNTLMVLDKARKFLAQAKTYDEAAKIRSQAEALRAHSQQQSFPSSATTTQPRSSSGRSGKWEPSWR